MFIVREQISGKVHVTCEGTTKYSDMADSTKITLNCVKVNKLCYETKIVVTLHAFDTFDCQL